LRSFEEGPAELRLAEVARKTQLDDGDAGQALATLCQDGFLDRTAHGTYRLGQAVMVLGRRTAQATGLDGAETILQQLTARTGESSSLAVRRGAHAIVLLLAPSPQRLRVEHGVGSHLPLHASAMGKALSAFADQEPEIATTDLGRLDAFTSRTITSQSEFVAELRVARAQGWAVNHEERYEGVVGVAAPVIVAGRGAVAAIGVQGPAARLKPDERALTRLVRRTAQHVAECLAFGYPLPGYDERVEPASHS